jgi:hypothetical protein
MTLPGSIQDREYQKFREASDGLPAVAAILEGDQNLDGGYITNEQTTINMMSRGSGFWGDGTNDTIIAPDVAAHDVGTGDFFLQAKFNKTNVTDANAFLINKEAGGIGYGLEIREDDLWIRIDDDTADASAIIGTGVFSALTDYDVLVTFDRDGLATAYVNGAIVGTVDISTASLTLDNSGAFTMFSETGATTKPFGGAIYLARMGKAIPTTTQRNELIAGNVPKSMQWSVVTANFTPDSISETYWYDKAGNSDAAVTGAVVLNPPSVTPLSCLHSQTIRLSPGTTPNTNIDCEDRDVGMWGQLAITDATDLAKDASAGSFSLAANGYTLTMDVGKEVVGILGYGIKSQDLNSSSATEVYEISCGVSSGDVSFQFFKTGSSSFVDITTILDAGDRWDVWVSYVTAT